MLAKAWDLIECLIQRSRVETILERARQQAKGTSDVIENSHKWGLKVWSLPKILSWLENFKAQIGSIKRKSAPGAAGDAAQQQQQRQQHKSVGVHTRSQSLGNLAALNGGGGSGGGVAAPDPPRNLVAPYLKFEAHSAAFRPVFCEFRHFPALNYEGQSGTSPFYRQDSTKGGRGGGGAGGASKQKEAAQAAQQLAAQNQSGRGKSALSKRLLRGDDTSKQHKDPKK